MTEATLERPTFSLISQPWIPCLGMDGAVKEYSLLEVFKEAKQLKAIAAELPITDFALLRLCLAIVYAAHRDKTLDTELWAEWFEEGLPADDIERYFEEQSDYFDLFHPETPFFQVAGLRNSKDERFGLERLILDVPAGAPFMTTRIGEGLESISYSEGARALVTLQSFDVSGIKTGAVGDPRVKGGKGYGIGPGWTGRLGGVFFEGINLHDTFMLNLVGTHPGSGDRWTNDAPAWETFHWTAGDAQAAVNSDIEATGPQALYTWQNRRVRLFPEDGVIKHVIVAQGDPLAPQNMFELEPMSGWRNSPAQQKALKSSVPVYMPREHDPARMLWRNVGSLLPTERNNTSTEERFKSSESSEWLGELYLDAMLPHDYPVRLHGVGLAYGSQQAVVDELYDDVVSGQLATFASTSQHVQQAINNAIEASEQAVLALRNLAANIATSKGLGVEGPREEASTLAYATLDAPFREWFSRVTPENIEELLPEWVERALSLIMTIGLDMTARAVSISFFGREHQERRYNAPLSEAWFRSALAKIRKSFISPTNTEERA